MTPHYLWTDIETTALYQRNTKCYNTQLNVQTYKIILMDIHCPISQRFTYFDFFKEERVEKIVKMAFGAAKGAENYFSLHQTIILYFISESIKIH